MAENVVSTMLISKKDNDMIGTRHGLLRLLFKRMQRKLRVRSYRKSQGKKLRKLLRRKDKIIADAFAILDNHLLPASIGQVGGFHPSEKITASWFGDVLVGKPSETWPQWKPKVGKQTFLTPLAQFNLTEVPFLPDKLKRFEMITVFIDAEKLPSDTPHGEGWLVRGYESLDELVPLPQPDVNFGLNAFPMKWMIEENDGPSWDGVFEITDLTEFSLVTDSEFFDRYDNSERTKLGGYPALIQGELKFNMNDFVFQIGSEEKVSWMWGDSGIGYFGLDDNGQWLFEWTCY